VLEDEGGKDDDPADHGGRTAFGILQREYDAWRKEQGLPQQDVWKISEAELRTIYHDEYWMPYCDSLPTGVDYLYFDLAVNGGPHRATLMLQRALGVTQDGRIGPITRAAIKAANPQSLITRFSNAKREWYRSLHQPRFINGWLNRVNHVQNVATQMTQET
jgi:lysozyme family protein